MMPNRSSTPASTDIKSLGEKQEAHKMNIPQGFAAFFQGAHLTDAEIELLTQIAQKDELAVVTMQLILLKAVQASIQVRSLILIRGWQNR